MVKQFNNEMQARIQDNRRMSELLYLYWQRVGLCPVTNTHMLDVFCSAGGHLQRCDRESALADDNLFNIRKLQTKKWVYYQKKYWSHYQYGKYNKSAALGSPKETSHWAQYHGLQQGRRSQGGLEKPWSTLKASVEAFGHWRQSAMERVRRHPSVHKGGMACATKELPQQPSGGKEPAATLHPRSLAPRTFLPQIDLTSHLRNRRSESKVNATWYPWLSLQMQRDHRCHPHLRVTIRIVITIILIYTMHHILTVNITTSIVPESWTNLNVLTSIIIIWLFGRIKIFSFDLNTK